MRVRVTAPYVTIKSEQGTDGVAVRGYYAGAIVDVSEEAVAHLFRKGMVEEVEEVEEPQPEPVKEPSVKDVLAAVGEDSEAAAAALEAEQAKGDDARKSLVEGLQKVIAASSGGQ